MKKWIAAKANTEDDETNWTRIVRVGGREVLWMRIWEHDYPPEPLCYKCCIQLCAMMTKAHYGGVTIGDRYTTSLSEAKKRLDETATKILQFFGVKEDE